MEKENYRESSKDVFVSDQLIYSACIGCMMPKSMKYHGIVYTWNEEKLIYVNDVGEELHVVDE